MFRKNKNNEVPRSRECGVEWTTGGYGDVKKRLHECGESIVSPSKIYHAGPHKCKRCGAEKPQ